MPEGIPVMMLKSTGKGKIPKGLHISKNIRARSSGRELIPGLFMPNLSSLSADSTSYNIAKIMKALGTVKLIFIVLAQKC